MGVSKIRPDKNCEHNFKVMEVVYTTCEHRLNTDYYRITTFFCTKCLQEVEEQKHETVGLYEKMPLWYNKRGGE